jgi:hypothetical protein
MRSEWLAAWELVQRAGVFRLIEADRASAARDLQRGEQTEAFVADRRFELHTFRFQLVDSALDVVTHQEQLVLPDLSAPARPWMDPELRRGEREDQPAVVVVHEREAKNVAEECTGRGSVVGKDERVHSGDHSCIIPDGATSKRGAWKR